MGEFLYMELEAVAVAIMAGAQVCLGLAAVMEAEAEGLLMQTQQ
jgi:hypothetical protein